MGKLITLNLSQEGKTFVSFMLLYFRPGWVKELNARTDHSRWQYVTSEVVRIAHNGDYEQVNRSFEMPAYFLSWSLNSGRVNGATHLAVRQMDVKTVLSLIAALRDQNITGDAVARYLMELNLQPMREVLA